MKRLAFDVLVVGAGPAGLAAAVSAAHGGARVAVIDDNANAGGQIWRGGERGAPDRQARLWFEHIRTGGVSVLNQTRVVAPLDDGTLLAETPDAAIEARFERLILATGARERFLPFPGWTLPGVIGAGGLQALVKGGLPIAGKRVVVAGSGPLLIAVAAYLRRKRANVPIIAEQTPWNRLALFALSLARAPEKLVQAARLSRDLRGVAFQAGSWVVQAHGGERIEAVTLCWNGRTWTERCDYLACGFGLVPNVELPMALGCAIVAGAVQADQWQRTSRATVYAAGEVTGIGGLELSLVEGQIAGFAATDRMNEAQRLFARRARDQRFAAAIARAFALRQELKSLARPDTIVCRCEDVSYGDLEASRSWRSAKLHARCGMGPCQGRVCGAATEFLFGWAQDSVRPPISATRLENLIYEFNVKKGEFEGAGSAPLNRGWDHVDTARSLLGWPPAPFGWHPGRGWHLVGEQFSHRPLMITQSGRHRRRSFLPLQSGITWRLLTERVMRPAEVVTAPYQPHPSVEQTLGVSNRPATPHQAGQRTAKRGVQAFNVGGVDIRPSASRLQHRRDGDLAALNNPPLHTAEAALGVVLDELSNQQSLLRFQTRSAGLTSRHTPPKHLAKGTDVAAQAVHTDQDCRRQSAPSHLLDQRCDQMTVAMHTDGTTQPQARWHGHRHCLPNLASDHFHPQFVGLYVLEVDLALLDQMLVKLLAGTSQPARDRTLIQAKGCLSSLGRTAMRKQGQHNRDQIDRQPQTIEWRASRSGEGFATSATAIAALLLAMDRNIALAHLTPCRAVQVMAELCHWVHLGPPYDERCKPRRIECQMSPVFSSAGPFDHG